MLQIYGNYLNEGVTGKGLTEVILETEISKIKGKSNYT
jgi:hypothetical protein